MFSRWQAKEWLVSETQHFPIYAHLQAAAHRWGWLHTEGDLSAELCFPEYKSGHSPISRSLQCMIISIPIYHTVTAHLVWIQWMDHSRVNQDTTALYRLRDWTRIRVRRARTLTGAICTLLISVPSVMLAITVSVRAHLYLQLNRAC